MNNKMLAKGCFNIIAGPCSIESYDSLFETAQLLKQYGISFIRGGAYKLRTSMHSFRGLGDKGILYLSQVGKELGLTTVSECTQVDKVEFMASKIDILVVGARNMYNYPLLERLSKIENQVILKRGFSATYIEWLAAAEYIVENGNKNVVLCERGIRTFETETRYTLDVSAIQMMKLKCNLPVIVDPSHAAGIGTIVPSLSLASVAAGADGLMIECQINPEKSISDASQTVDPITVRSIHDNSVNLLGRLV